jgi:hypothetical protein
MYYLIRGFQNDSSRDLAIGIALGFVLVLIRQLALVLFVGMALAYPVKYGVTARNIGKVILLNAAGLLLHVLYQDWLIHTGRMPMLLAHSDLNYLLNISNRGWYMRNVTLGTISYIGFLCLPLVALLLQSRSSGVWHWQSGRINLAFVVPAILLAGLVGWKGGMMPSMTNVLTSYGLGPMTLRDTYLLSTNLPFIPETATLLWGMTTALSILAGAIILCHVCALAKRALADLASPSTRPATWLFWMLAAMALSYFLILLLISGTLTVFERYFLVFVPVVVLLLVNRMRDDGASVRPQAFIVPTVLILAYAGFSVAATRDYLEWNRMRWQASNTLMTDKKITPAEIDGGYEFNGLYLYDPGYVQKKGKSWWWVVGDQYVIASGPLTGYSELKRYPFKRWLLQSEDQVLVLRKD